MVGDVNTPPSQALFYISHNNNYNGSTVSTNDNDIYTDTHTSMCVFINCALLVSEDNSKSNAQSMTTIGSQGQGQGQGGTMITLSMAMSLALCKVGTIVRLSIYLCTHSPTYPLREIHPLDLDHLPSQHYFPLNVLLHFSSSSSS